MRIKGACCDVGSVMMLNCTPPYLPADVRREPQTIRENLHCNPVRVNGSDMRRLALASRATIEYTSLWGPFLGQIMLS